MRTAPGVRLLAPGDLDAWGALWRAYQEFYGIELPSAVTRETWFRLLGEDVPLRGAVAEIDGQVVGFAHWVYHESTWAIGRYSYLHDLFVAPTARSRGLGRALMNFVFRESSLAGCSRVYWLTRTDNAAARMLYDQEGTRGDLVYYRRALGLVDHPARGDPAGS